MAKRKSEAERKALYDLWCQSALTQDEFCRQNNIGKASIWRWCKKFRALSESGKATVPLDAKDIKFYAVSQAATPENNLEITLSQGISCKVYLPVDSIYKLILELCR